MHAHGFARRVLRTRTLLHGAQRTTSLRFCFTRARASVLRTTLPRWFCCARSDLCTPRLPACLNFCAFLLRFAFARIARARLRIVDAHRARVSCARSLRIGCAATHRIGLSVLRCAHAHWITVYAHARCALCAAFAHAVDQFALRAHGSRGLSDQRARTAAFCGYRFTRVGSTPARAIVCAWFYTCVYAQIVCVYADQLLAIVWFAQVGRFAGCAVARCRCTRGSLLHTARLDLWISCFARAAHARACCTPLRCRAARLTRLRVPRALRHLHHARRARARIFCYRLPTGAAAHRAGSVIGFTTLRYARGFVAPPAAFTTTTYRHTSGQRPITVALRVPRCVTLRTLARLRIGSINAAARARIGCAAHVVVALSFTLVAIALFDVCVHASKGCGVVTRTFYATHIYLTLRCLARFPHTHVVDFTSIRCQIVVTRVTLPVRCVDVYVSVYVYVHLRLLPSLHSHLMYFTLVVRVTDTRVAAFTLHVLSVTRTHTRRLRVTPHTSIVCMVLRIGGVALIDRLQIHRICSMFCVLRVVFHARCLRYARASFFAFCVVFVASLRRFDRVCVSGAHRSTFSRRSIVAFDFAFARCRSSRCIFRYTRIVYVIVFGFARSVCTAFSLRCARAARSTHHGLRFAVCRTFAALLRCARAPYHTRTARTLRTALQIFACAYALPWLRGSGHGVCAVLRNGSRSDTRGHRGARTHAYCVGLLWRMAVCGAA